MDRMEEYVHHAQDRRPSSVFRWIPKGSIHDRCRAADRRIPHDFRRHPARRPPELGRAQKSRGYHACEGALLGTGNRNLRRDCASPGSVSHYHHSPSSLAASYPFFPLSFIEKLYARRFRRPHPTGCPSPARVRSVGSFEPSGACSANRASNGPQPGRVSPGLRLPPVAP